jgi:small conductance mechanosensitive channel
MDKSQIIEKVSDLAIIYAPKVLLAILTLIIGFWLIAWVTRLAKRMMAKKEMDESLRPFLGSIISIGLKVLLLLSVVSMFGVETTSFIAVFTALAFAIGMALQGSLGNFASGVMILLFKPYKVGDLVSMQGFTGVIEEIQIFNTFLITPENKTVIIPNTVVTSGPITNISQKGTLRVDMTFGIGYQDDIDKARSVIEGIIDAQDKILKDPAADILISELADSSVNFAVRPWCKSEHYWDVYFYVHEEVKKAFDKENVSIPFPQMDVHMQGTN